jgi:hypothetical protein
MLPRLWRCIGGGLCMIINKGFVLHGGSLDSVASPKPNGLCRLPTAANHSSGWPSLLQANALSSNPSAPTQFHRGRSPHSHPGVFAVNQRRQSVPNLYFGPRSPSVASLTGHCDFFSPGLREDSTRYVWLYHWTLPHGCAVPRTLLPCMNPGCPEIQYICMTALPNR